MSGVRHDSRWRTAVAPAALLVAAGLLTGSQAVLLAAVVPLGYLAYGALSSVPDVRSAIAVERELSVDTPYPGEHVTVTVRVRNEGDASIPDLRVVDGVPGGVEPVSGATEAVFALRPGESAALEYTLVAQRGSHEFGSVALRARSLSAAGVSRADVEPAGDSEMFCRVYVEDAPVRDQTMRFVGAIPTKTGGAGIEFHSTRNYQRGDPMNRIDWRRLAKTGELTTIEYRVQEAARVLVVVDARDSVAVTAGPEYPSARELSSYAAELLSGVLLDEGHEAGIAVFGMDLPGTAGAGDLSVLEPSSGDTFRAHVTAICSAIAKGDPSAATAPDRVQATAPTGSDGTDAAGGESGAGGDTDGPGRVGRDGRSQSSGSAGSPGRQSTSRAPGDGAPETDGGRPRGRDVDPQELRQVDQLRGYLGQHTQVLFVTPAIDEFPVAATETLEGHGHSVTVLSPDVTDTGTVGGRLARVRRGERIEDLRALGASVVDWPLSTPLPLVVAPAFREVR